MISGRVKTQSPLARGTSFLCLLCLLLGGSHPLHSQPAPDAAQFPLLSDDERLKRMISLEEKGTTMSELLKRLSTKELTLIADKSCAEQKLHIHLKNRSLQTLMTALADLLPALWHFKPEDRSYVIEMQPSAVQRRSKWWKLYLEERDKALAKMQNLVYAKFRQAPYRRRPSDPRP